jgi:hypothetical protein
MSAFSYRQRVGEIDWRAISSVKIDEIILNAESKPLQNVLDIVTFCDFRPVDVKNNSIEIVSKLVNILQLICEYLLQCQEAQFKLIRECNIKADKQKELIVKVKKENLALKEDRKIYQRQLAMLRKSLGPDFFLNGGGHQVSERVAPKITHLFDINKENLSLEACVEKQEPKRNIDAEVITSILKHEEETRDFMNRMLNEQRESFLVEIRKLTSEFSKKPTTPRQSSTEGSLAWANTLQSQMENTMKKAVENMQHTVSDALNAISLEQKRAAVNNATASIESRKRPASSASEATKVEYQLKEAALEEFEQELSRREAALVRRVASVEGREMQVAAQAELLQGRRELSTAALRASDTERLDLLTTNEALWERSRALAARCMHTTFGQGMVC